MSHEVEESAQEGQLQERRQEQRLAPAPPPPPPQPLPPPRAFLTDLLTSLPPGQVPVEQDNGVTARAATRAPAGVGAASSSSSFSSSANPLRALQGKDRNALLTLHVLFPNELLPALDLLDRGLVTRFRVADNEAQTPREATTAPGSLDGPAASDDQRAEQEGQQHRRRAAGQTSSRVEISNAVGVSDVGSGNDGGRRLAATAAATNTNTHATAAPVVDPPQPPLFAGEGYHADPAHLLPRRRPAAGAESKPAAELSPKEKKGLPAAVVSTLYYVRSAQQQQYQHHRRSRYGHSHSRGAQQRCYDNNDFEEDERVDDAPALSPLSSSLNVYEVRLAAWSCSCPAFAFAAFPANLREPSPEPAGMHADGGEGVASQVAAGADAGAGGGSNASYSGEDVWEEFGFGGLRRGGGLGMVPPVCKHLLACLLVERAPALFGECVKERAVGVDEAAAWAAGWGG
ncbi:hypothetical protein B0J12DRAFT_134030 [Macrophomina phaseolina]|uniref:SWIM-type domain-containing protein n=1 Tax=Macrophomina phaseolina TaxID=35725 RepID=A0ABQ8G6T9_9PEZI|nr:hypothetical protein B0J12DRAFT_134030 [Macrophomina phaseolina]